MHTRSRLFIIISILLIMAAVPALACQAVTRPFERLSTPTPFPSATLQDLESLNPTTSPPTVQPTLLDTPTPRHELAPLATNTPRPTITETSQGEPPTPTATQLPLQLQLSIFEDLWKIVHDEYLYLDFNGLDWDAIHIEYRQKIEDGLTNAEFYLAMDEMIFRLGDDHSVFLNPEAAAEEDAEYEGNLDYVGIGVLISAVPERNRAVILVVFPGSPAEASGLQSRDSILTVDGSPILDEDGYLRDIVRGIEGTSIDIVVQTPGEAPRELTITRHRINSPYPLPYTVLTTASGKRIGYILLITFADETIDDQVGDALRAMTVDAPLDGLIIDDQENPGGYDTVLIPTLAYFTSGTLGHFVNRVEEYPLEIRALNNINGSGQVPLVVLVGEGTASFGEVFAGVLKDIGRAYIIGQTTDGNVEILWGYDFEDGSRAYIAHDSFRPIKHPDEIWEETGIIPDLTVITSFDEYTLDNDPAIIAALDYFDGQ
jgi:carboxyl-terminal processing protease